jgi:hypothetical protein
LSMIIHRALWWWTMGVFSAISWILKN